MGEPVVAMAIIRRPLPVFDAGLSSSVYQRCYPVSVSRPVSMVRCGAKTQPSSVACCYEQQCGQQLHALLADTLNTKATMLLQALYSRPVVFMGLRPLLDEVASHILLMSEEEPFGVRGARLVLRLNSKKHAAHGTAGVIIMDCGTVSTFELVITVTEHTPFGLCLSNWIRAHLGGASARQKLQISPNYSIQKRKLYR